MEWPELRYADWADTCATLHMWTQIAGKIRMAGTPPINHWWHVTLYVNSRGLTTSMIPNNGRPFEIEFDFLAQRLTIAAGEARRQIALEPMTVADFYQRVMQALRELNIDIQINTMPQEVPDPIPFEQDREHHSYNPAAARRFWRVLVSSCEVLSRFRSRFIGKVSPVHFFWGSFDLAVSRFSGRRAPKHAPIPGVSYPMILEAYSHECSSVGWWPGGNGSDAAYFSYTYPAPDGFSKAGVRPAAAAWSDSLGEFVLPYEALRADRNPENALMEFCQSTYEAGAELAHWPRQELERAS